MFIAVNGMTRLDGLIGYLHQPATKIDKVRQSIRYLHLCRRVGSARQQVGPLLFAVSSCGAGSPNTVQHPGIVPQHPGMSRRFQRSPEEQCCREQSFALFHTKDRNSTIENDIFCLYTVGLYFIF